MFLALFPLQLAIFPGEHLPLHIFEPRYKQLIAECRDDGITFGIPTFSAGNISKYGTEVELLSILETYDTGEMDIIVRGLRVFRIDTLQSNVPGKLYSGARVTLVKNDPAADPQTQDQVLQRFHDFLRLLHKNFTVPAEIPENLSFIIGAQARLSLDQRLTLLAMPRETDRQAFLIDHLDAAIRAIRRRPSDRVKVGGNGRARSAGGQHL